MRRTRVPLAMLGAGALITALFGPVAQADPPLDGPEPAPDAQPVVIVDPAPPRPSGRTVAPRARASAPLSQTFELHSNPSSDVTIFIDVDGQDVSGTAWNIVKLLLAGPQPAWDPADDGASFSDGELTKVQEVWRRVTEDFAPFDVDVTTEDPGPAGLERSGPGDPTYGVRALVTPSTSALTALCGSCGGIAYVDVIGDSYYSPAWVFAQRMWGRADYVAEAVSHEVGHTLGLHHDGAGDLGYYAGHGSWAPIMGASYNRAVTQWSDGGYPGATNAEDDLAILADHLGLRPDEAGGTVRTARRLGNGRGVIATRGDKDVLALGRCSGRIRVAASPAADGADLDIRLELLSANGRRLRVADPTGLSAVATTTLRRAAPLYARVDGTGHGTTATGYDDYASLGAYTLTRTGRCR